MKRVLAIVLFAALSACANVDVLLGSRSQKTYTGTGTNLVASWGSVETFPPVAGYSLWLDAAKTDTVTLDGSAVTSWGDRSGFGHNATNGNASTAPSYSANVYGGKAGIVFCDSVKSLLSVMTVTNCHTVFIVLRPNNLPATYSVPLGHWAGSENKGGSLYVKDTGRSASYPLYNSGVLWDNAASTALFVRSNACIYAEQIVQDGTASLFGRKDGVLDFAVTGTYMPNSVAAGLWIGRTLNDSYIYCGSIHEVLFYPSVLASNQIQQVEAYLGTKWAITVTP